MFFLSNNLETQTYNHRGLLELEKILLNNIDGPQLINFIENPDEDIDINNIQISKSRGVIRFYLPLRWSINILHQSQIILLCKQFEAFKEVPHILTFDGLEFKLLNYDQTYLDNLTSLYLNKDIYIGVPTNIPVDCYIYSANIASLTLLHDLLVDAYGIMLAYDDIQTALQHSNSKTRFIFNREIGLQVIDCNYLKIITAITSMEYIIHKAAFFYLIQTYNDHKHSSRDIFCAKTTIIIDGPNAQLDLID